jgi:FlaA1/EpsC-like NDP-sugar epimerase
MNRPFFSGLRLVVLLLDMALFAAAYAGAFVVRVELAPYPAASDHYARTLLVLVVIKTLVFVLAGTYRGLVTYAGMPELLAIVRNSTAASVLVLGAFATLASQPYSRGVLLIDWLLTIVLLSSCRAALRMFREGLRPLSSSSRAALKRVLIVGAGRAGVALAKDLLTTRRPEVDVIGFVDDDPEKQHGTLLGRPILGTTRDLPEIPNRRRVDQVIVAIPSAPPRVLKRIAELARGVRDFRVIPPLEALLRGKASLVQAMPVPEETFLSRGTVDLAAAELVRFFKGKTVLVTGAGGSIGSELARQLSQHGSASLRRLLLLDAAETPLYDIHRQARATLGDRAVPVLASVRDLGRLDELLRAERPDVILHAAALKHVAMCEAHPLEALATNSMGTSRLADLAEQHGVANFTLVSTDKAVAPSCVMGASKRAAETYLRALSQGSPTRFAAVRFGNVLGSNGSVLPLFHEQISRGGPVTVTDPRATRFFMTIPEACGLILQATRIAQGGEIYILDMGDPVRILDVAHNLIRLYGYEPGKDIEVKVIGLRAGEKLHESLMDEGEGAEPIRQGKLLRVRGRAVSSERCRALMAALEQAVHRRDEEEALRLVCALVPTFTREGAEGRSAGARLRAQVAL